MEYFISDTHFGHKGMLKFERTHFKDIEEHDEYIITKFNERVKNTDTCYILGDLGISREHIKNCFDKMNGKKIIVLGNHDKYSIDFYKKLNGVIEVHKYPIFISKRIVLSHEPIKIDDEILNIHGHLHGAILNLKNYYCVSEHVVNYIPINKKTIDKKLHTIPKDSHKFNEEWYKDYYMTIES